MLSVAEDHLRALIVDWLRKRFPEEKRLQQLSVSSS
jgi:hypothetical protein